MDTRQQIRQYCQQFRMNGIQSELDEIILDAEKQKNGYLEFTKRLLEVELGYRNNQRWPTGLGWLNCHPPVT